MFCTNCGAQNADNATFCANCGAALNANTQQQQAQPTSYDDTCVLNETPAQQPYNNQAYSQPEYIPTVEAAPTSDPGKVFGIISLICGILGLLNACCYGTGLIYAIAGLILGNIGGKKSTEAGFENKLAKTGKTLSIIGLILSILAVVGFIIYYVVIVALASM